jgi:hypothetical protein
MKIKRKVIFIAPNAKLPMYWIAKRITFVPLSMGNVVTTFHQNIHLVLARKTSVTVSNILF